MGTSGTGSWVTDNVEEQLTLDGEPVLTWAGFELFSVFGRGTQTFLGGPADESVWMYSQPGHGLSSASMGAGDDYVTLSSSSIDGTAPGIGLSGGTGHDVLCVEPAHGVSLRFDEPAGLFTVGSAQQALSGFEDAYLHATRVR